ncbi:hypothetical protein CEE45_10480 [Candidatus Heimdallarchaeota archaeon B3_Heim]|nr:MAG: hypothetical protein CEE45_10480 [Candidatus Heimdallarchaeota archaeon B3_Heim]
MTHWKKITKKYLPNLLIISSLIITIIPINMITSIYLIESVEKDIYGNSILKGSEGFTKIPRLTQESFTYFSYGGEGRGENLDLSSQPFNNRLPDFAIRSQKGEGGSSFTVEDYLTLTGSDAVPVNDNHWQTNPEEHEDQYPLTIPANFVNSSLTLNISDVIAIDDWRLIENDSDSADPRTSTIFSEFAQEFVVEEDYVNVSSLRLFIDMDDTDGGDGQKPHGKLLLLNDTSGSPDDSDVLHSQALESHSSIAGLLDGNDWAGWLDYSISPEVILPKGTYWFALNDTKDGGTGSWNWHTVDDSGQIDNGDVYFKFDHGDSWGPYIACDIVMMPKVCPVKNISSTYPAKEYTDPTALVFQYKTSIDATNLSTFTMFEGNMTSDNIHTFNVNTSVNFTLSWWIEVNYTNNPIIPSVHYFVENTTTLPKWNLTFVTNIVSTVYNIRNRSINVFNLPNDWAEGAIFHDGSLVYNSTNSGGFNGSIGYNDGDSNLIVNASTLSGTKTWDISFNAPNYITEFNWFDQILGSNVTFATSMDTLKPKITFKTPNEGGYNFSVWIESQSGTRIYTDCNKTVGEIANDWNITETTASLPVVNGTYQTYAFWENTTENQVGFYARNITVFIHTTPIINAPTEVIEDTSLEIIVYYNATHNSTGVNNANVTGMPDWGDQKPVQFEHSYSPHGYYNYTWDINSSHLAGQQLNITIFLEMPWHINHTVVWNTTVVYTSTITALDVPNPLILEYGQSYLLRVNYSSGTTFISGATMIVDGDNENFTEEPKHFSYLLYTTNYNSGESYSNLLIHLNNSGYLSQELYFNLTITAGPTSVHQAYTPIIASIYYTESYSFAVFYENTVDNEGITNADSSTSHPSAIDFWYSNSSGYYFFNLSSSSLSLGSYTINVTLNHSIYQENFILLTFNIVEMSTQPLDSYSISSDQIMVEETITVTIDEFQTYKSDSIGTIDNASILLNGSSVDPSLVSFSSNAPFSIVLDTAGVQYGKYNMTIILSIYGYENQAISFNVSIDGYETEISVEIKPGTNIRQGEDIIFIATLAYVTEGGAGAGVTQQVPLGRVIITFYIVLEYDNGTTQIYEGTELTDDSSYRATYTIDGIYTIDAVKLTNITIHSSPGLSGLPYTYKMSATELETYEILPPAIDIFELITTVLIAVVVVLISLVIAVSTIRVFRRRRRSRKQLILRHDIAVEQSFEDIKSIRLILARHQSGLQFYSEKTIAELQTDTDALSGMSAALSSFMEELSESMTSQSEEVKERDKIEFLSREGLHMLIWHGNHSSFIIISEVRLPEYFQSHLKALGNELEDKYTAELQDFYSSDQIPNTVVKKMVRKYIPLHYFSAYVANEGVLTLDSVKLSRKQAKMFNEIKKVMFKIEGAHYFFSEQIISHLSKRYKRSEAIEFLDQAIKINLLIEAEQEDLLQLTKL